MPLVRARCQACSEPLGDAPHVPIRVACSGCGTPHTVPFAADGQPAESDAAFPPERLARWIESARASMARGAVGIALGPCGRCGSALVLSSRAPLRLPCPHCQVPVEGPAGALLVDQWPEPFSKVDAGPDHQMEYRLVVLDARGEQAAGCAACGQPTPPADPSMTCRRCRAVIWVERDGPPEDPGTHRVQLGLRADGLRAGRPFKELLSLAQGAVRFRADAAHGRSARSGTSLLGVTGIGCAVAIALMVLFAVTVAILVKAMK